MGTDAEGTQIPSLSHALQMNVKVMSVTSDRENFDHDSSLSKYPNKLTVIHHTGHYNLLYRKNQREFLGREVTESGQKYWNNIVQAKDMKIKNLESDLARIATDLSSRPMSTLDDKTKNLQLENDSLREEILRLRAPSSTTEMTKNLQLENDILRTEIKQLNAKLAKSSITTTTTTPEETKTKQTPSNITPIHPTPTTTTSNEVATHLKAYREQIKEFQLLQKKHEKLLASMEGLREENKALEQQVSGGGGGDKGVWERRERDQQEVIARMKQRMDEQRREYSAEIAALTLEVRELRGVGNSRFEEKFFKTLAAIWLRAGDLMEKARTSLYGPASERSEMTSRISTMQIIYEILKTREELVAEIDDERWRKNLLMEDFQYNWEIPIDTCRKCMKKCSISEFPELGVVVCSRCLAQTKSNHGR